MIACVKEAVGIVLERQAQKEAALARARRVYVEALCRAQAPAGGAAEVIAASELLGVDPYEFKYQANLGSVSYSLRQELIKANQEHSRARGAGDSLERQLESMRYNDPSRAEVEGRMWAERRAEEKARHSVEVLRLSAASLNERAPEFFKMARETPLIPPSATVTGDSGAAAPAEVDTAPADGAADSVVTASSAVVASEAAGEAQAPNTVERETERDMDPARDVESGDDVLAGAPGISEDPTAPGRD